MAEQSDQDVDMEPAYPNTGETECPGSRPTSMAAITDQKSEPKNTNDPPPQEDQQANKDTQRDQEQRKQVTGREVMQAARPLQTLLRKNPEQTHQEPKPNTTRTHPQAQQ